MNHKMSNLESWLNQAKHDGLVKMTPTQTPKIKVETTNGRKGKLRRRTVSTITEYLQPKAIFDLITRKTCSYTDDNAVEYHSRDRAFMALAFECGGRVTAIVGGPRFLNFHTCLKCGGEVKKLLVEYRGEEDRRWVCIQCKLDYGRRKPKNITQTREVDRHPGLMQTNLVIDDQFIHIEKMTVVKRKHDTIEKYGKGVSTRSPFVLPLKTGLFETPFWDQLVPFSYLVLDYVKGYNPQGKLFDFQRGRAWQIVQEITGLFPNWFRAQCEHFYGNYIYKEAVKLAKFIGVINPMQTAHYIGYSYEDQLKDKSLAMDFDWIPKTVEEIKRGKYDY